MTAPRWLPGEERAVKLGLVATCARCRAPIPTGADALANAWGDVRHVQCRPRAPASCSCECHRSHAAGVESVCCPRCDPRAYVECIHGREGWEGCALGCFR